MTQYDFRRHVHPATTRDMKTSFARLPLSPLRLIATALALSVGLIASGCTNAMEQDDGGDGAIIEVDTVTDAHLATDATDATSASDVIDITDAADSADSADTGPGCPSVSGATSCSVLLAWDDFALACSPPGQIDWTGALPVSDADCVRLCPALSGPMPLTCRASLGRIGSVLRCSRC